MLCDFWHWHLLMGIIHLAHLGGKVAGAGRPPAALAWAPTWTPSQINSSNTLIHCQPGQEETRSHCVKTLSKTTAFLPANHLGDSFCFALIAPDTVSYIATCQIMSKLWYAAMLQTVFIANFTLKCYFISLRNLVPYLLISVFHLELISLSMMSASSPKVSCLIFPNTLG